MTASETICHRVLASAERSHVAIRSKINHAWEDWTWPEYFDRIECLASALLELGLQPKDRVAIVSNTRREWSVTDYAVLGIQAVVIPIYQTVSTEDLEYMLTSTKPKVLFLETNQQLKTFLKMKDKCPSIQKVVLYEGSSSADATSWNEFLAIGKQEKDSHQGKFRKLCQTTRLEDTATILFTSGTSGRPKGVVLTHQQIMSEVGEAFPLFGITTADISLSFLPYAHVLGRLEHWGHMHVGFTMAFAESIEKIRSNLSEIRPTLLIAVPRIFEKVYSGLWAQMESNFFKNKIFRWALAAGLKAGDHHLKRQPLPNTLALPALLSQNLVLSKVRDAFGGRLRFAVCGGASLAREISLFFHACGLLILEGYGLTETTAATFVNRPYDYRFGSVGKPIGDVQVKIADDGEILIRSHKIMKEYLDDPAATAEVLIDGWFHTGDIGEILPSGDLKITDRKKDLIKTAGGKYVAPQRLENILKMNPLISNVLIHGDQKKFIVALITLDPIMLKKYASERGISETDVRKLSAHPQIMDLIRKGVSEANTHLASFESIKRFAVLPDDFTIEAGELTPSLKVKRKVLDAKFKKQIESLYT